jgi:hypothetical protein
MCYTFSWYYDFYKSLNLTMWQGLLPLMHDVKEQGNAQTITNDMFWFLFATCSISIFDFSNFTTIKLLFDFYAFYKRPWHDTIYTSFPLILTFVSVQMHKMKYYKMYIKMSGVGLHHLVFLFSSNKQNIP